MSDETAVVTEPKRRGRPPKAEAPPIPENYGTQQYDLDRVLESFLGKTEVSLMRANGSYPSVFARYREKVEGALAWEAQPSCPHCQARPGYNPLTGMWVRSWDASKRQWIDGHHNSCKTLMVSPLHSLALR